MPTTPRSPSTSTAAGSSARAKSRPRRHRARGALAPVSSAARPPQALHWDGEPRLTRFLIEFCGAVGDGDTLDERTDSATYIQAVTRAFFISAVARVFKPGCKADCMLILEGAQGAAKSRLLRKLAIRDQWFSDSLPHDLTSKDARQHLAGHWLVEMGEIASSAAPRSRPSNPTSRVSSISTGRPMAALMSVRRGSAFSSAPPIPAPTCTTPPATVASGPSRWGQSGSPR